MDETLRSMFTRTLGIEEQTTEWDTLTYRGIREWDSVAHMRLVGEIEDTFEVSLDTDDVIAMTSYPAARQILARYGIRFDRT